MNTARAACSSSTPWGGERLLVSYLAGIPFTIGPRSGLRSHRCAPLLRQKPGGRLRRRSLPRGERLGRGAHPVRLDRSRHQQLGHGGGIIGGMLLGKILGYGERRPEATVDRLLALFCVAATWRCWVGPPSAPWSSGSGRDGKAQKPAAQACIVAGYHYTVLNAHSLDEGPVCRPAPGDALRLAYNRPQGRTTPQGGKHMNKSDLIDAIAKGAEISKAAAGRHWTPPSPPSAIP